MHHQAQHPDTQRSSNTDYNVKDAGRELSDERWPLGSARARAGGVSSWTNAADKTDLVEQMYYLYVRVVKARDLPTSPVTGACDPYAEIKLGNYKGTTKYMVKKTMPEWNQIFAFSKERVQSSLLEVFIKDKETIGRDEYVGRVVFDLNEVPTRVQPDSPLAPQWYRLEDRRGRKVRGEVMLAVWVGTQADEAFSEAWHADAVNVNGEAAMLTTRSKVYVSPKLWYLRVNVIEAQDLEPNDRGRVPEAFVRAQLGNQVLMTKVAIDRSPVWNEDLVFVAAEPFEEQLVLSVENRVTPRKDEVLGRVAVPLATLDKRLDYRPVPSRWFDLEKFGLANSLEPDAVRREQRFASRLHLRASLEGGYHVVDESSMYTSDQRPTSRQLWLPPVGMLEIGFLGAEGLPPMKSRGGRATTDAFCVAKYGQKWVRTRTVLDSAAPRWNEQYTWEVYDLCTVITIGVFDNGSASATPTKDARIGKVRIRVAALESDRTYRHSYPLITLQPTGVQKMGELRLAIRFTVISLSHTLHLYTRPLLPKMHYLHPFTVSQVEALRHQAMGIVAARLGRAEPPLRKEVVEYLLDVESHLWSMRRSKANFFRIMSLLSGTIHFLQWLGKVREWGNPATTALLHVLFVILIWYPELILPTLFLYLFVNGLWNYRWRPRHPPHMDTKLSWAEAAMPDELDEEFDTFPTSRPMDVVHIRYDRLRSIAGRVQTVVGDIATQGERLQSLLSWKDPRATALFVICCLAAAVLLYVTPFKVVALATGLWWLRHPRFRSKLPSVPSNFFKRLPSKVDSLL